MSVSAITDYRELARKKLPRQLFDFIDGGAFHETTIKRNSEDFDQVLIRKKILQDVSSIDTTTSLFGQTLKQPVILAPVGFAGLFARRGEVQATKAANEAGVPFCLSSLSICSIEEIRKETPETFWFQLYMLKDKGLCLELLHRAQAAECPVLMVTVDITSTGIRYRDIQNGMSRSTAKQTILGNVRQMWDIISHPRWAYDVSLSGRPLALGNFSQAYWKETRKWVQSQVDFALSWKDLEWLRANWPGKLIIKGILNPEDALAVVKIGADGLVVSNHAGRHLDSQPSSISALPAIVETTEGRIKILFDGGIRSGLDVIKALALGANACLIGRPWAFALAARGEQGVTEVLNTLQYEIQNAMTQLGVTSIKEINKNCIIK